MAERGTGSKIMSFTNKRARRLQEKVSEAFLVSREAVWLASETSLGVGLASLG